MFWLNVSLAVLAALMLSPTVTAKPAPVALKPSVLLRKTVPSLTWKPPVKVLAVGPASSRTPRSVLLKDEPVPLMTPVMVRSVSTAPLLPTWTMRVPAMPRSTLAVMAAVLVLMPLKVRLPPRVSWPAPVAVTEPPVMVRAPMVSVLVWRSNLPSVAMVRLEVSLI